MTPIAELYALQEIDAALDAARAALEQVESGLGEDDELTEARGRLEEREAALHAAEAAFKDREFEADQLAAKITPIEQKLYKGDLRNPKELEDLQQDLDSLKRRRSELEDRALEAMEALEAEQQAMVKMRGELQQMNAGWESEQGDLGGRRERLMADIAGLEERRAQQLSQVEPRLLPLYDTLYAGRRGRAVVKVAGGACAGCRISLPVNVIQRARGGLEVVQCTSCERILFVI